MSAVLFYFAYGSNLLPERLRRRTPSRRLLGTAELSGYSLRFHKRSHVDGSAKANAYFTGRIDDRVLGVVYSIDTAEKPALDEAESLGRGYNIAQALLPWDTERNCFFYVADPAYIDDDAVPFVWYRDLCLHGARFHGFPKAYVSHIAAIPVKPDPDRERAALHREILGVIHGRVESEPRR